MVKGALQHEVEVELIAVIIEAFKVPTYLPMGKQSSSFKLPIFT